MTSYNQPVKDFTAGDTVRFSLSLSGFPASLNTLAFTIRSGTSLLTVNGTPNGDAFDVVFTAEQTVLLKPGEYAATGLLTNIATGDKATVRFAGALGFYFSGYHPSGFHVLPNLTNATVGPRRAAYNAALAARDGLMAKKYASTSVDNQTYTLQNLDSFQKMIQILAVEAMDEDRQLGISSAGGLVRIVTRM